MDQEWDLLSYRQAHRPAGVTRLLEMIVDESAFERLRHPGAMAGQLPRLLAAPPRSAHPRLSRSFDVLSFAGTTDRIGVSYAAVLGAELASRSLYDIWARIEKNSAADPAQSRAILERYLAALG